MKSSFTSANKRERLLQCFLFSHHSTHHLRAAIIGTIHYLTVIADKGETYVSIHRIVYKNDIALVINLLFILSSALIASNVTMWGKLFISLCVMTTELFKRSHDLRRRKGMQVSDKLRKMKH